jgi:SNF2 family DNA or RNA helicase
LFCVAYFSFFYRKDDVLKLPEKKRFRVRCPLSATLQQDVYEELVKGSKQQWSEGGGAMRTANNILMELRKAASHPLLLSRVAYSEETADAIARIMHRQVAPYYDMDRQKVLDTVSTMSDYQLHQICAANDCLKVWLFCLVFFSFSNIPVGACVESGRSGEQQRQDGQSDEAAEAVPRRREARASV